MFDANMRHLPEGHHFIADVWGVQEGTTLYQCGVRKHSYVLCTMMEDQDDNPRVTFHLDGNDVVVDSHSEGLFAYHILYMGTVNGDGSLTDFKNGNDKSRAERFMKERNLSEVKSELG